MKTNLHKTQFKAILVLLLSMGTAVAFAKPRPKLKNRTNQQNWVGTWGTARQLVEPNNMPPAPGLNHNTLRQVICVSIGGSSLKLKISNEFGDEPMELKSVQIAVSKGDSAIDASTSKVLKFGGKSNVTLNAGTELFSDPVAFNLQPRMLVAITIVFSEVPAAITGHPGSRTTSYILAGQHPSPSAAYKDAIKTDHWYVINGIDVDAPGSPGSVVVLGDSITDGRGSGTNKQDRWPDVLATSLQKRNNTGSIGVLNMGIGGNAVLKGGLGPTGLKRFEHDVLKQSGAKWLIIFEGVNDIGGTRDSLAAFDVAKGLIAAYDTMITKAHIKGLKVFGATITPFKKNNYYRPYRDAAREMINQWIRTSGHFDAVIDFDKLLRDPNNPDTLLTELQSGANDYLHPNELGYKIMGEGVPWGLFQ